MGVVRTLIAVGDAHTRGALQSSLGGDGRFSVAADSDDAADAVVAAIEHRPDLCLIDVGLRGHGVAAAWEIAARLPRARIVMLSSSAKKHDVLAAFRAGAVGYLPKDIDAAGLGRALWDVSRGSVAIPRALMALVVDEFREPSALLSATAEMSQPPRLTGREWQVLALVNQSLSTGEIAKQLSLTPATVRSHRTRALRKLGALSGGEASCAETVPNRRPVLDGEQYVVIASPDRRLRARLRATLSVELELLRCAEATNPQAAISAVVERNAAVCILDRTLDRSSVQVTAMLAQRLPGTKVIVLASDPQPQDLRAHIWAGAAGYLDRTTTMGRLPYVIRSVLEGHAAIPRGLVPSLVADLRDSAPRRRTMVAADVGGSLTSREWHVLELLHRGRSTREIAGRLYISQVTVRTHVASILRKLEVPDRAAALRVAARLLDPQDPLLRRLSRAS